MRIEYLKNNRMKALLPYAVPSIIAMLLETVITVTDGYFTGNYVGETALAAINLGLPVLYFYLFTPILDLLHADSELRGYFTEYYKLMLIAYPLMVLCTITGMFIRVEGKPQYCMFASIIGCVWNAAFDYLMVAKLRMGIRGSALATLCVQGITVLLQLSYFLGKGRNIRFCKFSFDREINRETLLNGSSECIGEMASAPCSPLTMC